MALTTASGVLGLLNEPGEGMTNHKLKAAALNRLMPLVDDHWAEIANSIPVIEELYEDEAFPEQNLAAAVASKVYYHLEALDEAVSYALGAGDKLDITQHSEYVETLIAQCVDRYIRMKALKHEGKLPEGDIDPRLQAIVERMFQRCYADGEYKQALGIAVESRMLDKIEESVMRAPDQSEMLAYLFALCQRHIDHRGFRLKVLQKIVDIYAQQPVPDYINITRSLYFLNQPERVAKILEQLILEGVDPTLTAFQIAFDLYENQNPPFLHGVLRNLTIPGEDEKPAAAAAAAAAAGGDAAADSSSSEATSSSDDAAAASPTETTATTTATTGATPTTDDAAADSSTASVSSKQYSAEVTHRSTLLRRILSGRRSADLYLQFCYSHNHADSYIMNNIMDKLDNRTSLTHNAAVIAHSLLQCGTTRDTFLRNNLEWLSRASNWAKFTASASFGVVHKGHVKESLKLLGSYLPKPGQQGSPYQEGGALYALGLIHSSHGDEKIEYVMDQLRKVGHNEIIQHGACLGLGLVAMSTQRDDVFQLLKDTLFADNAVSGEAAGLAMGLTLLGSANPQAIQDMIAYAHETKHEKIVRGLAIGLSLMVVGREEEGDALIEQLVTDKDPIMRYGGCFAIALSYAATGHNRSVKRLLHIAVSDVSGDVRRAAVMCIGFVLANTPEQVPEIVKLLAESFNPNARYGAAMAIGVACAATGLPQAIEILETLIKDRVDYVKQAAQMALAMVLNQQNKTQTPKVEEALEHFTKQIDPKNMFQVEKMGAIIASGLMFAGGNNCTISMMSEDGNKRIASIVGIAVWLQHWYWYPYMHFLSLAITPTAVIGLNIDLEMPRYFRFKSAAAPDLYDYPPYIKTKVADKKKKVVAAELSITAKAKARKERKKKELEEDTDMDTAEDGEKKTDEKKESETDSNSMDTSDDSGKDGDKQKDGDNDGEEEDGDNAECKWAKELDAKYATSKVVKIMHNPCRVTPSQQAVVGIVDNQRYVPVKRKLTGIVVLRDSQPNEPTCLIESKKIAGSDVDNEPSPPAPFQFTRL